IWVPWGLAIACSLPVEDRLEAAVDHALAIERWIPVLILHALVGHRLRPAGVAGRLVGPFDPGVDHGLALLRLHRPAVVGQLAVRHVVPPGLDHTDGA